MGLSDLISTLLLIIHETNIPETQNIVTEFQRAYLALLARWQGLTLSGVQPWSEWLQGKLLVWLT